MHKEWQRKFNFATQSPFVIAKSTYSLFVERYDGKKNIRSVTVKAINLLSDTTPVQLDLFNNMASLEKQSKIDNCIEALRSRFGKEIIKNGVLLKNTWLMKNQPKLTMPTGLMNMN